MTCYSMHLRAVACGANDETTLYLIRLFDMHICNGHKIN